VGFFWVGGFFCGGGGGLFFVFFCVVWCGGFVLVFSKMLSDKLSLPRILATASRFQGRGAKSSNGREATI